jgi:hypothetical protein
MMIKEVRGKMPREFSKIPTGTFSCTTVENYEKFQFKLIGPGWNRSSASQMGLHITTTK